MIISLLILIYIIGLILQWFIITYLLIVSNYDEYRLNNINDIRSLMYEHFNDNSSGPLLFFGSILWPMSIVFTLIYLIITVVLPHLLLKIFKKHENS